MVCYGHNHQYSVEKQGSTLLINPGEVYGKRTGSATFAIFDTQTKQVQRIEL